MQLARSVQGRTHHPGARTGRPAALETPVGREMLERTRGAYQDLLNNTNLELLALDLDKAGMCFHVKTYLIVLGATALTIHGALGVDDANDAPEAFAPRETVYDQVVASLRA